jgi:hypothetical protein
MFKICSAGDQRERESLSITYFLDNDALQQVGLTKRLTQNVANGMFMCLTQNLPKILDAIHLTTITSQRRVQGANRSASHSIHMQHQKHPLRQRPS